jgi:hypothetical protein
MSLIRIFLNENGELNISVHWIIYCILFIVVIIWLYNVFKNRIAFHKNIEIDSVELGIKGQKIKIKPNYTNIEIAYKIWVELNTRKIGLPIDFENDVIVEVYDSWYKFFDITRQLLKSLPATKIRNDKDTKELIEISTMILNEGLRPHLTVWQAKFRKWYDQQLMNPDNINSCPQEIQEKFKDFKSLKEDMERVNKQLIYYKSVIYKIAFN